MNTEKKNRLPQMGFEMTPELIEELKEIKRITRIPKSQFVREAIWEKIAVTKQNHPAFQSQNLNSTAKMPNQ